ncbi:hypothetical protein Glove_221g86 [Diversispora epigaea]|uniref:BZIP domain-containing protein n=1 Tax=Diversispora epigaea TaxID=1348612 RepID=A0A397IIB2_9GLOM|nr:hypothetical protein Glove_221g86 [Diversispora epigaea]
MDNFRLEDIAPTPEMILFDANFTYVTEAAINDFINNLEDKGETPKERKRRINRIAVIKCRKKRKAKNEEIIKKVNALEEENSYLTNLVKQLQEEVNELKNATFLL